jgi:AcrR family transcriptional regulator
MLRSDMADEPTTNGHVRHGGRQRSPALDEGIIRAATKVLAELGPAEFTLEAVAREVGCAKSSIYRRYGSRTALIVEVGRRLFDETVPEESANLLADVIQIRARSLSRPVATTVLMCLMAEAATGGEIGRVFVDSIFAPIRVNRMEVLTRAIEHGEIQADTDLELLLDVISGTLSFRAAIRGEVEADLADRLLEMLLRGVASRA